jgi:RNA polymerase sigma-70 factor (ECF subfamily)
MQSAVTVISRYLADEPYRRLHPDALWAAVRGPADEAAVRVFLERVSRGLFVRCHALLGDTALAEDAVQDSLIRLIRHRRRLADFDSAVAWLHATARNSAREVRRRATRAGRRERAVARPEAAHDVNERLLDSAAVRAAALEVPGRAGDAVRLVYLGQLSHAEAAEVLGVPVGSVGSYVRRGLDRLRQRFPLSPEATAGLLAGAALPAVAGPAPAALTEPVVAALRAAPAGWLAGWKVAAVAAGLVVAGGLAATPSLRPPAPDPPPAPVSVADRNRRVFLADVLPQLTAALAPLGGPARLDRLDAYGPRVDAALTVPHHPGWDTRLRFVADADRRDTLILLDWLGTGRYDRVLQPDPGRPVLALREPLTGRPLTVPLRPLADALAAFDHLPRDGHTAAAGGQFRRGVAAAAAPLLGQWDRRGDPADRWTLGWEGDRLRFRPPAGSAWAWADGRTWMTVEPDGPGAAALLIEDRRLSVSPDGRRLEFDEPGFWWTRPPAAGG